MGSDNEIPCVMSREVAFDVASTEVPVVAKTKANLQNVKAAYAKKKKLLTVKGKVAGSKGVATGKVKITVKKGKKTVKKVTVKLNAKGAFTAKVKKFKAKGQAQGRDPVPGRRELHQGPGHQAVQGLT